MPWQQYVADVVLELDPVALELVYSEFGLTVPRQSGKSTLLLAKAVHRASATKFFGPRQRIVYTAQTRHKAREKWEEDYVADLEASRSFKSKIQVHRGNGNEHIRFANGSRFGIEANTEKAGHGGTLDEAYIDEAFAHVDNRLEQAFRPAMITRRNRQLGWVSTAGWVDGSEYLQAKIKRARDQVELGLDEGLAYFEWSAPETADPLDPAVWSGCMPAVGLTISPAAIAAEAQTMELPDFRRAYLNQWVPKGAAAVQWAVISEGRWSARGGVEGRPDSPVAFGVACAWPDAEVTSIGVAGRRGDDLLVQLVDRRPGTSWVLDRVLELRERYGPCAIVLDAGSPANRLVPDLEAAGVELVMPSMREVAQSSAGIRDAVMGDAPSLRHYDQDELSAAVAAATKRPLGDSWTWARRDADVSALEAVSLAAWGHATRSHVVEEKPQSFFGSWR